MRLVFSDQAWEDYLHWQQTDPTKVEKINTLIKDVKRDSFKGLGKPEPLKGPLAGWWSRRIDSEHRMVYKVSGGDLWIAQLRYHY
ncbi:MAG: Txe/YoeB family addiction module toxin [Acidobacteria bacterium]|nr:Txe/YoeB family addiction module toxin [Acidobacteriota bacterium]